MSALTQLSRCLVVVVGGTLLGFVGCIKVKREFTVTKPALPTAAERSQQAVFELRNSVMVSVAGDSVQSVLDEVKTEFSGKDIVSPKQPDPKPKDVLGGKLETSIGKVVTNICIQNLGVKAAGKGPLSFVLTIQTCGFQVTVLDAKAALRAKDQLSGKPMNVVIGELRLKDKLGIRTFEVEGDLSSDASGVIKLGRQPRLSGLESLSDPDSYDYQPISSDEDGLAGKLRKPREVLTKEIVKELLSLLQGYLSNSIHDGVTKAFRKFSEKFNNRGFSLNGRAVVFQVGASEYGLTAKLGGLYGEKNLAAAIGLQLNDLKPGSESLKGCRVESYAQFPDPGANWLRGNPMVRSFGTFLNASGSPQQAALPRAAALIPYSLVDYGLWKVFGSIGVCTWDIQSRDATESLTLRYLEPWKFSVSQETNVESKVTPEKSIVSVNIPDLQINLPLAMQDAVQSELVKQGLVLANEDVARNLAFKNLRYDLSIIATGQKDGKAARLAVLDEDLYLPRARVELTDTLSDLIRNLRQKPSFAQLGLESKKSEIAQILITSVLNTYLAKRFHDTPLAAYQQEAKEDLQVQSIKFSEEALYIEVLKQTPFISRHSFTETPKMRRMVPADTIALTEEPNPLSDDAAIAKLSELGVPTVIGMRQTDAGDLIRKLSAVPPGTCQSDAPVIVPLDNVSSSVVSYIQCSKPAVSVEYRLHNEIGNSSLELSEGPVVYTRTLLQWKDVSGAPGADPRRSYRQFIESVGKPNAEFDAKGGYIAEWLFGKLNLTLHGFCKTDATPCPLDDRIVTSIEQWMQ